MRRVTAGLLLLGLLVSACTPRVVAPVAVARGAWLDVPDAPLGPRAGSSAVWAGDEFVVWGGFERGAPNGLEAVPRADGAAYHPARERWRPLPPASVRPAFAGLSQHMVWTGDEVVVLPQDAGRVAGDADGDGRADRVYGARLAQHWSRELAPGEETVFTTRTRFLVP
jgi:hypothetical protein